MMADQITSFSGENAFLSNFHPHPITMGGVKYATLEHAYQAAKSHDSAERDFIRRAPKPGDAKRRGRAIKLRADWEKVKYELMEKLVREKFTDKVLAGMLIATGDAELIEGNTWKDIVWGMVRRQDGVLVGQNHLGKILMKIRGELQAPKVERSIIV